MLSIQSISNSSILLNIIFISSFYGTAVGVSLGKLNVELLLALILLLSPKVTESDFLKSCLAFQNII